MSDGARENSAMSALMGRGWMQNITTLKAWANAADGGAASARRFGIYFDDSAAAQAMRFKVALADLGAQFSGLSVAIGESALPMFSRLMTAMQGMEPNLKALGLRILAISAASTTVGIPLAIKMWHEADKAAGEATQAMTDFLLRAQSLAAGQKASADSDL